MWVNINNPIRADTGWELSFEVARIKANWGTCSDVPPV